MTNWRLQDFQITEVQPLWYNYFMYKDFADFLQVLIDKGLFDVAEVRIITERYLVKEGTLSEDDLNILNNLKKFLEEQKAKSEELAKGT